MEAVLHPTADGPGWKQPSWEEVYFMRKLILTTADLLNGDRGHVNRGNRDR